VYLWTERKEEGGRKREGGREGQRKVSHEGNISSKHFIPGGNSNFLMGGAWADTGGCWEVTLL